MRNVNVFQVHAQWRVLFIPSCRLPMTKGRDAGDIMEEKDTVPGWAGSSAAGHRGEPCYFLMAVLKVPS